MAKFTILLLFFPLIAFSFEITDHISHLEHDPKGPTLILLSGGKVVKYSLKKNKDEALLEEGRSSKRLIKFYLKKDRTVRRFELLPSVRGSKLIEMRAGPYAPTVLDSLEATIAIFKNLRRGSTSWSQCFNRAHVWAYESKNKYDLDSMKVFLFFTSRYIRRYDYEWWFHVAPFTLTKEEEEVRERVLDFKFSRSPLQMKNWTDLFMINKASCPVVEKYSQYRQHQDQEDCYLMKESMYYLQPLDLSQLEETGRGRSKWNSYEVKRAYRNGFGIW